MAKAHTDIEVVELIRKAIRQAGSQVQLASDWGVSTTYISDIVNGRRKISDNIASRLGLVNAGWAPRKDAAK